MPSRTFSRARRNMARALLALFRWRLVGAPPPVPHYVIIAAPHTSNWDLLWLLLMAWAHEMPIRWLAKAELFFWPLGWFLRGLGGVPVQRSRRENRVALTAEAFAERDRMVLVVPPEGTRSYTPHWKSGFLQIARAANVPLVPTALDYGNSIGEIGAPVDPQRPDPEVMSQLRTFYAGRAGRIPADFGPVRLQDE